MLRTWRAKERGEEEGKKKMWGKRRTVHRTTRKVSIRVHARCWKMQGPSSLAFVKPEKLEFIYICELPLRICRGTTLAGYSVNSEQRAAAPVPRPFFSPQARDTTRRSPYARISVSDERNKKKTRWKKESIVAIVGSPQIPHFKIQ